MEYPNKLQKVIRLETVSSTNQYLAKLLREEDVPNGTALIVDYQTEGRGQAGNSWFASKGKNLLFSIAIYPQNIQAEEQFLILQIISLAIKSTLDQCIDSVRIKWPNDIYVGDKKIGGILIENNIQGKSIESSIIGIGLNINQEIFPFELPNPISMKQITGVEHNLTSIFDTFEHEFFTLYRALERGEKSAIRDEYMFDLYRATDFYWFEDVSGKFQAKITNVLPSGQLVLEILDAKEERIYGFREIVFLNE